MNRNKLIKLLLLLIFPILVMWAMLFFIPPNIPNILILLIVAVLLGLMSVYTFSFLTLLINILKAMHKEKLFFAISLSMFLISIFIILLFFDSTISYLLLVFVPTSLVTIIYSGFQVLFRTPKISIFQKLLKLFLGIIALIVTSLTAVIISAIIIDANYPQYGYHSWTFDVLSLPKTIENYYYFKTGNHKVLSSYLEHISPKKNNIFLSQITANVNRDIWTDVPKLNSGKIAFIKNDNLWIAENNGKAHQITTDAGHNSNNLFTLSSKYRFPTWSPKGDRLVFQQSESLGSSFFIRYLLTDGKQIFVDQFLDYENLPPYWLDNDTVLIPTIGNLRAKIVTQNDNKIALSFNNDKLSGYFNGYSIADGCGGGGRPAWSYLLSENHLGGMDGIRASLFYLDSIQKIIYSTGCESNISLKLGSEDKESSFFDERRKPYMVYKGLGKIPGESIPFLFRTYPNSWEFYSGPNEFTISPDKKMIIGSDRKNIVLYDSNINFVKTLWSSGKAYGPVFSNDSKTIYFADNFGENPSLVKIDLDTNKSKEIFKLDKIGAISNISVSPDNSQVVFTLIEQTVAIGEKSDEKWFSEAVENLFIINSDGSKLTKFVEDASQSSWSPK